MIKAILLAAMLVIPNLVYGQPYPAAITYDQELVHTRTGQEFEVKVFFDVAPVDTVFFCRLSLEYDPAVIQCVSILNGADVPANVYSEPFVNWGPVWNGDEYISQQVFLGMFWQPQTENRYVQWSGHALTYRFRAIGPGRTVIRSVEYRTRMNYIDMQPWTCYPGYTAEYTTDLNGLQDCLDPLSNEDVSVVVRGPRVPKIKNPVPVGKVAGIGSLVYKDKTLNEWALMSDRPAGPMNPVPIPWWSAKRLYR